MVGALVSSIVFYLNENDAGSGFYRLAVELNLLTPKPTADQKLAFWAGQVKATYEYYADSRRLVDKLWSYCNVLRDDGVGVIEYTEQLTYLLFLKMAHERATRKLNPQQIVPAEYSWQRLLDAEGDRARGRPTPRSSSASRSSPARSARSSARRRTGSRTRPSSSGSSSTSSTRRTGRPSGTDIKGDAYEELLSKGAVGQGLRRRAVLHAARR